MSKENICKKLRLVVSEFGQDAIKMNEVCIIGSNEHLTEVGGHRYIYAPTISIETLTNCNFKVARYFEDA